MARRLRPLIGIKEQETTKQTIGPIRRTQLLPEMFGPIDPVDSGDVLHQLGTLKQNQFFIDSKIAQRLQFAA